MGSRDVTPHFDRSQLLAHHRAAHLRDLRERALGPWRMMRRRRAEDALVRRLHRISGPRADER